MYLWRCVRQFSKAQPFIEKESRYGCHNYHPLPIVITRGKGIYVWDVDGKRYMDFLAAYSAVNQGHCHDRILATLVDQAQKLPLTSRAFYNDVLGSAEEYVSKTFGYDKVLFMNSGVEAGESAIKFARRWAYNIKKVPDNQARILFARGNFWGRTIAACGSSDDPERYKGFGPYDGLKFDLVDYNDPAQVEEAFKSNANYAGFMFEPIQGEMGVVIPSDGYLTKIRELCTKYKVLMITDEIQTGLGRTGKMLACDHENVRPDMVLLGKALSGGFYPISVVLADDEIMLQIKPGEHGSTYGGNPLASALCQTALQVLIDEKMIENTARLGVILNEGLQKLKGKHIKAVRSRGLMAAIEFEQTKDPKLAWNVCLALAENGLACKPTHGTTIRLTPPLCITEDQLKEALDIIKKTVASI